MLSFAIGELEVLQRLKESEAQLRATGVQHVALFGSVARGQQTPASDRDILVEVDEQRISSVYDYVTIVNPIEDMFPLKVDVSNRAALKPHVRPSAERDAIYAF